MEIQIRNRLVRRGRKLFKAPAKQQRFTGNAKADKMCNDLERTPHAFVLGCLMVQQIRAERAWIIPYELKNRLGGFSMRKLISLSEKDVHRLMTRPTPLHRFSKMSTYLHSGIQRIKVQYGGDASRIWSDLPSSAEVVYRFLEFDGAGPKIATMAANLLARSYKIPFSDYVSIDISADVHIRRVFSRLGLCSSNATTSQVIYKARALYPKFPGLMDYPTWEVGRNWCHSRKPDCNECYMRDLCPTVTSQ